MDKINIKGIFNEITLKAVMLVIMCVVWFLMNLFFTIPGCVTVRVAIQITNSSITAANWIVENNVKTKYICYLH